MRVIIVLDGLGRCQIGKVSALVPTDALHGALSKAFAENS